MVQFVSTKIVLCVCSFILSCLHSFHSFHFEGLGVSFMSISGSIHSSNHVFTPFIHPSFEKELGVSFMSISISIHSSFHVFIPFIHLTFERNWVFHSCPFLVPFIHPSISSFLSFIALLKMNCVFHSCSLWVPFLHSYASFCSLQRLVMVEDNFGGNKLYHWNNVLLVVLSPSLPCSLASSILATYCSRKLQGCTVNSWGLWDGNVFIVPCGIHHFILFWLALSHTR